MAAITSIVINDATPSARTYSPMSIIGGVSTFVDRLSQSSVAGQSTLVIDFSPMTSNRSTDKVTIRLNLPKVVNVLGVDTVDSVGRFTGNTFIIPATWTTTERAHLRALVANAMANALVIATIKDRDPVY